LLLLAQAQYSILIILKGILRLRQQEQTEIHRLVRTMKLAAGVVSAALIIAAITIALF